VVAQDDMVVPSPAKSFQNLRLGKEEDHLIKHRKSEECFSQKRLYSAFHNFIEQLAHHPPFCKAGHNL